MIVLNTTPEWYGGEFHDLVYGDPEYERAVADLFVEAGFEHLDFETVQEYGTTEQAIATSGFIFGSDVIDELRRRGQSRISWRWRLYDRRKRRHDRPRGWRSPREATQRK